MGMYDNVTFFCNCCNSEIQEQSKAGVCDLKNYHQSAVPMAIAADLNEIEIICGNCGTLFYISPDIPRVALHLTTKKLCVDYD